MVPIVALRLLLSRIYAADPRWSIRLLGRE